MIEWPKFLENGLPTAQNSMTVGVFDGVHLGHRALIERVVSHNAGSTPVVITFRENHKTEGRYDNILTFHEKLAALEQLGIKTAVVIDFTESFRQMSGTEFLETLLKHGNIGFFAVGSNFRCGHKLDTDAQAIRRFFESRNIPVEIVSEVMHGQLPISSSRIRAAIACGDLQLAQAMLSEPHTISTSSSVILG